MKKKIGRKRHHRPHPPKRPGSTIPPPEAKMAARPDSMTSYRNPKQEVDTIRGSNAGSFWRYW